MLLRDLLSESPMFLPPSGSESIFDDRGTYISAKTYKRSYTKIGVFPLPVALGDHKSVDILLSNSTKSVVGVVPAVRPIDGDVGYKDVFFLMFKDTLPPNLPPELHQSKMLQIDGVETHIELRGRGLSTFVYFLLMNLGYTIISDFYHEVGGLKLWRKLSKLSGNNEYAINIIDNGQFVRDAAGNILNFDGTNYPKSKVWSTTPNDKNKNVLLVMRSVK
jgi:hypothetical protein